MQQRSAAAAGRPSGTDGFDFSYRMVVDSRYTKVAKGKSRLKSLLFVQTALQAIGSLLLVLASQEKGYDKLAVVSIFVGFISLLFGELGRRRSHPNLLRLYLSLSVIATTFSAVHSSGLFLMVYQTKTYSSITSYELGEAFYVMFGVSLQILATITISLLLQNMSPKRTS